MGYNFKKSPWIFCNTSLKIKIQMRLFSVTADFSLSSLLISIFIGVIFNFFLLNLLFCFMYLLLVLQMLPLYDILCEF